MKVPDRIPQGTKWSDARPWLDALTAAVKANQLKGDGRTLMVQRTPGGSTASIKQGIGERNGSSGDTYTGFFLPSNTTSGGTQKVTVSAGHVVVGNSKVDVSETELTITAAAWIYIQVTYSSGYVASIQQSSSYPVPVAGTWKKVIATVTWADSAISAINRQQAGPVHYEG